VKDPRESERSEKVDLFYRNPLEIVEELIGNPDFNHPDLMSYEPAEVFVGPEGCSDDELVREYSEASTGKWWNSLQVG
jgi:hypothetical protein